MNDAAAADIELVTRIGQKDMSALAELHARHAKALLVVAARVLDDDEEAADIVQHVFEALPERSRLFSPTRGSVIAWLVVMVRNASIDHRRRGRVARRAAARVGAENELDGPGPESVVDARAAAERVRSALASLADANRRVLEDAFYGGLSYPEIATRLEVPLGTVKSRACRAMSALRIALVDA